MKREAITHTKMKRLCRRLDIPTWQAVGILESLWHLTARETPRGDIGKLSDEDIALGIDYRGDEGALLRALAESGWLDANADHRYIVHDWSDHADDGVQRKVARELQYFADGRAPNLKRLNKKERGDSEVLAAWERRTAGVLTSDSGAQEAEPGAQTTEQESGRTAGVLPEPKPLPSPSPEPRPEPCRSPALPEPAGVETRESSNAVHEPATSQNGKPVSQRLDDDEKPKPEVWATPDDELKAIVLKKTGKPIKISTLDAVREQLAARGYSMAEYVREIRENHLRGHWDNPDGLLTYLAAHLRSKSARSAPPVKAPDSSDKCPKCGCTRGKGLVMTVAGRAQPCECATPAYRESLGFPASAVT